MAYVIVRLFLQAQYEINSLMVRLSGIRLKLIGILSANNLTSAFVVIL